MSSQICLIHSPLVGPFVWRPVADALQQRGHRVVVPELKDVPGSDLPFWAQHARSAADGILRAQKEGPCVLVAHSGAGPLLPAIAQRLRRPVKQLIFVDAGLPAPNATRLEMLAAEDADAARTLEADLRAGKTFPAWRDDDLRAEIADAAQRSALLRQLRPRGLGYFTERIAAAADWAVLGGAYVQFTDAYARHAAAARAHGWRVVPMPGAHFHTLNAPDAVATIIESLT